MRTTAIVLAMATLLSVAGCDRIGSPEPTARVPALQFDIPVSGEITTRSGMNFNNGSRYQLYQIRLEDQQRVGIKLTGALSGTVTVFSDGKVVAHSRTGYESSDAAVAFRAPGRGLYQVAVSADGAEAFGPFRLRAEVIKPHDGTPIINTGRVSDLLLDASQDYTLQVDTAGLYAIELRSDVFDTVLSLKGEGQDAENDDDEDGEGTDSRIHLALQPGRYTLSVRGLSDEDTGAFTLDVRRSEAPAAAPDNNGSTVQ
ncbi:hypothetical protein [Stenotrophomonas sp.]|uniref:hypothetical protein n=1 Tax=Stenotrophomonas sp. TaxID=69392 RepID=UPI002D64C926|nr:hypothetical protein [Stenotrophomonas sp.]HYQ25234.1 hypothetical protein [Stenotrophomonas sp.]